MSFAPISEANRKPFPVWRVVAFWIVMLVLALVVWQLVKSPAEISDHRISYAEFLRQVEQKNVGSAEIRESANATEVTGTLRQSSQEYRTTVPSENVTNLTSRLRDEGTAVEVAEIPAKSPIRRLLEYSVVILLIVVCFLVLGRRPAKQTSSNASV